MAFVANQAQIVNGWRRQTISTIAFLHCAAVVVPAISIALPRPKAHNFELDVGMALIHMSNQVVAPLSIVLHFIAQLRESKSQHGESGALSLIALGIQVVVIAVLGVRWFLRLGRPVWGDGPVAMRSWYEWGFLAINYVLHAILCAFLLACYIFMGRRGSRHSELDERAPLLN